MLVKRGVRWVRGGRKGPESDLVLHLQRVSGEFRIMICPCSGSADEELTNNMSICPETLRKSKVKQFPVRFSNLIIQFPPHRVQCITIPVYM